MNSKKTLVFKEKKFGGLNPEDTFDHKCHCPEPNVEKGENMCKKCGGEKE